MVQVDGDVSISNNAEYVYACEYFYSVGHRECILVDSQFKTIRPQDVDWNQQAGWSIDNQRLLMLDSLRCELIGTPNARIFHTLTEQDSPLCLPDRALLSDWSPVEPPVMYLYDRMLLNTDTGVITPFEPPTTLNNDILNNDLSHYSGYGKYLWDIDRKIPAMVLDRLSANLPDGEITTSLFQVCTFRREQCMPIFNTLDVSRVDVFDGTLNGHWLLWGGYLSGTGKAQRTGSNRDLDSDMILYITNLTTGQTQEIFRFSSLRQPLLEVVNLLSWSPDRLTVALRVEQIAPLTVYDGAPLIPADPATVILHLNPDIFAGS